MIAAGVVIPPLVALYFLKLRRREVVISSTLLWRRAVQDLEVNAPFQKLKKNLLLLLQLLALLALLLAAGRPAWEARADPGERVVIVIDRSGSMNAEAGDGTRFDAAKREALSLLEAVGSSDDGKAGEAMVIAFDGRAQVVQPFTTNLSQAKRAVEALRPTDGSSRLADALRLIRPFTQQANAGRPVTVHVVSDGRVGGDEPGDTAGAANVSLPNVAVTFVRIGRPDDGSAAWPDNVAIVAASARRDHERPERVRVFAQVANLGPNPTSCRLTLRVDGRVTAAESVALPAAEPIVVRGDGTVDVPAAPTQSLRFTFDLPGEGLIQLTHDAAGTTGDALPADDSAYLLLAPAKRLRVLLVSPGNDFLRRAIRAAGVDHVDRVEGPAYEALDPAALVRSGPTAGYDVVIFDRHAPSNVPPVSSLYFAAAPPIEGLEVRRPTPAEAEAEADGDDDRPSATIVLDWRREHPVLQHVVMDDVVIAGAGRVVLPPQGVVLATGQRGPILAEVTTDALRHVVASFEIVGEAGLRTNWVKQVGFPVFVRNTVQVLGLGRLRDEAGIAYAPGDAAAVPAPPGLASLTYTGPRELTAPVIDGRAVLPTFPLAGLYTTEAPVEPPNNRLAVNMTSLRESDLRPAPKLTVGGTAADTRDGGGTVQKELWPWFVVPAIVVLMLEWFVWTRRVHL